MKQNLKRILVLTLVISTVFTLTACVNDTDSKIESQQEVLLTEANDRIGLPDIINFREKRLVSDLYELRDQEDLVTYTYVLSQYIGKYIFVGQTIGYGIPYATQFSNPERYAYNGTTLPQAEPNGLFSPASAEGTWVMMLDPTDKQVKPQYIEDRIYVYTFRLPDDIVINP